MIARFINLNLNELFNKAFANETSVSRNNEKVILDARGGNDRIHVHTNFDGSVTVDVNGREEYHFTAAEARNLVIRGGFGNDRITTSGWSVAGSPHITLEGGDGNDVIVGTDGHDHIDGGRGDDLIYGRGGDDWINGGLGDDRIDAGSGNDRVTGGGGWDLAIGGGGNDEIRDAQHVSRFPPIYISKNIIEL